MVYESDYSTRRVYSSAGSRPGISTSYSYSPGPVVGIQSPITPFANQLIYIPCNVPAMQMQYAVPQSVQLAPTPSRHYVSLDTPSSRSPRSEDYASNVSSYSKTYSSTSSSSGAPGSSKSYSTTSESTTRNTGAGPRSTSYSSESTRSTGDGPGGASYFSSASYKSPYGNNYRTFSYH